MSKTWNCPKCGHAAPIMINGHLLDDEGILQLCRIAERLNAAKGFDFIEKLLKGSDLPHEKPTRAQLEQRFMHHAPKNDQVERYGDVRLCLLNAAEECVRITPISPEQTRALNKLEEAMFLFNAAIARNE